MDNTFENLKERVRDYPTTITSEEIEYICQMYESIDLRKCNTMYGIDPDLIKYNQEKIIKKFLSHYPQIKEVKIFGSRAKGNYKPSSDIDLALFGNIDDKLLRHIASELDELPTPYQFDVLNYNDIDNENLKNNIDKFGKIF